MFLSAHTLSRIFDRKHCATKFMFRWHGSHTCLMFMRAEAVEVLSYLFHHLLLLCTYDLCGWVFVAVLMFPCDKGDMAVPAILSFCCKCCDLSPIKCYIFFFLDCK